MNIELNNETQNEVEYVEKSKHYARQRFKKYEILVFLGCLLLAFIMWCYANYLDDPIIQKEITVRFLLSGASETESIVENTENIIIYGEQSEISGINILTVYVSRSEFSEYNTPTKIAINYPEHIHSHQTHIELQIQDSSK